MNDCEKYQELISRMIDDDLSTDEKVILATHLKNCGECTAMYRAFLAVSKEMPDDPVSPPVGFSENVMAGIRRAEIKKRNRNAVKRVLAAAACLVLVSAVGIRLIPRAGSAAPETPLMAEPAADIAVTEEAPAEKAEAPRMSFAYKSTGIQAAPAAAPAAPVPEPESVVEYSDMSTNLNGIQEGSDSFFVSEDTYKAIISALADSEPPEPEDIERRLFVESDAGSVLLIFCGEKVYAQMDGTCYAVSLSAEELLSMIS